MRRHARAFGFALLLVALASLAACRDKSRGNASNGLQDDPGTKAGAQDDPIKPPVAGEVVNPQGGVKDPSIRPVGPKGGVKDPSITPMNPRGGLRDPSVQPVSPKAGANEDSIKPVIPQGPQPPAQ